MWKSIKNTANQVLRKKASFKTTDDPFWIKNVK